MLTFARNRGELAEGWYDRVTLQKAQASVTRPDAVHVESQSRPRDSPRYGSPGETEESSDGDVVGPAMLGGETKSYKGDKRAGPAIPKLQDLRLQRGIGRGRTICFQVYADIPPSHTELEQEDNLAHREDLRAHRHLDRKQQRERLDELIPRAEAGSKDRMLEKKREKADSNRGLASAKTDGGGGEDVAEADLLGDEDGGGIEGFKKQKREMDRKKNEREVRREEILRARMEELQERRREYQAKEEKTMSGLVALAKARFG